MISIVAFVKALYSASPFDLDVMPYFLLLQEIGLGPKNTTKPHVDRLSHRQC
jgi:hypothetical protein